MPRWVPLLLLAACGGPEVEDALPWEACGDGLMCATVPVDDGELAVAWRPAEEPSDDVVILAAGGPGGSSTSLLRRWAAEWSELDPELFRATEWISMDPRGTGARAPACVDDDWFDTLRTLDAVPGSEAEATALGALSEAFVAGCRQRHTDAQLRALGTQTAADDLDLLRETLEVETISYLGFSYGTWLGATYARRHPDHVDRFVLDAVVAPESTRDRFLRDQAEGFERALERFFARCEASPECVLAEPAATFDRLLAATPLAVPSDPRGRSITRNELRWVTADKLYGPDDAGLAEILAAADAGDTAPLMAAVDGSWGFDAESGHYNSILQGYYAIGCLDDPWPDGWDLDDVFAFGAQLDADFPRLGGALITGEASCLDWPVSTPATDLSGTEAPPMLLVAGLHDPATPWAGTERTWRALDNDSFLLTWEGDGHTALFRNDCTYRAMTGFLYDGTAPSVTSCPP